MLFTFETIIEKVQGITVGSDQNWAKPPSYELNHPFEEMLLYSILFGNS